MALPAIAREMSEWIGIGDWTLYVTFLQKDRSR